MTGSYALAVVLPFIMDPFDGVQKLLDERDSG